MVKTAIAKASQPEKTAQQGERSPNPLLQQNLSSKPHPLLTFQRSVGNRAVEQLIQSQQGTLQRTTAKPTEPTGIPPVVQDTLNSPGQPLDSNTRTFMESRFRQDFRQVRIHASAKAAKSAQAMNAQAYTVGQNVVFGSGQPSFQSLPERRLLAHELTHVVQQRSTTPFCTAQTTDAAENEADAIARKITESSFVPQSLTIGRQAHTLHRQQSSAAAAPVGMTRAEFEQTMTTRFGVASIRTGTQQEQESRLTPRGGVPPGGITIPNWQSWDPGATSPVYAFIIDSFEDFHTAIGGVPLVREILFFDIAFELNQAGTPVPQPRVGASFGAGHLTIYRALTTLNAALPISRSNLQDSYPPVGVAVTGTGSSPGAPLPLPSQEQSIRRLVGHELGHGLAEAALGPNLASAVDPSMMDDYQREVGWTGGSSAQLFDVGVAAVATALSAGTVPPANYQITPNNWNAPQWLEQPLSHYSVAGGPAEDFAESVMAFIHEPNLLLSRSPRRFQFLYRRRDRWLRRLLQIPQIGDFPEPRRDQVAV